MRTLDIYRALWRHRYFIVLMTGILVGATWYFTSRETPIYRASSLVRIQQQIQDPGQAWGALETGQRLAQTYAEIVKTRTLQDLIFEQLQGRIPPDQRNVAINAHAVQDLDLLRISARSSNRQWAMLVANAAPGVLRTFIAQTGTVKDEIVTIDSAKLPNEPVSPSLQLNIALAVVLGVLFNGALALLFELISDRLPSSEELEASLGQPVLGTIPVVTMLPGTIGLGRVGGDLAQRQETHFELRALDGLTPPLSAKPRSRGTHAG